MIFRISSSFQHIISDVVTCHIIRLWNQTYHKIPDMFSKNWKGLFANVRENTVVGSDFEKIKQFLGPEFLINLSPDL